MKSLNVKRIASVVAGAAIIGAGLAFSSVTFQNVPVITTSGQPVVQVVVGSNAKASDGVAAANIAAAIGNLAFTSVPVTASVNATQANKVLHVSVSNPSYTLSNQQVWLNESGSTGSSAGSYTFTTLIGSVLNSGITLGALGQAKFVQGSGQYSFPQNTGLTLSPAASPYTTTAFVPVTTTVTGSTNGGGFSSTTFTNSKNDNLLQITPTQLSVLANNAGAYGETENLWITGFPVYNQQLVSGTPTGFQMFDAGGSYQATFGKPIQINGTATSISNAVFFKGVNRLNAQIKILGQNWTVIGGAGPSGTIGSANTVAGGKIQLAASSTAVQTVYVGHNLTTGNFTIQLQDLGQSTSSGVSPAALAVYYQGKLTNTSTVYPGNTVKFNVTNKNVFVNVNNTFAGYYQYAKYAKLQAYTNVFNVTNGQVFNQTTNPGWNVNLLWTNTTKTSLGNAVALQSIILYNTTPTTLSAGQSFYFVQNPQSFKVTFLGDTLSAANFDPVTVTTTSVGSVSYANQPGITGGSVGNINNITEPAQDLIVSSQIPNAFTFSGQTASSVTYDLVPYNLKELNSTLTMNLPSYGVGSPVNVIVTATGQTPNLISSSYPLVVTLTGYPSNTATSATSTSLTFTANSFGANNIQVTTSNFYNITAIKLSRALPGLTVSTNGTVRATFSGSLAYANGVSAGNVPALGNPAASGNIVLQTFQGTVNSINFNGLVSSGSTVPFNGFLDVNSIGAVVNTISGTNTLQLRGNLVVQGVIPISGTGTPGNILLSGTVPVSNNIAYTAGAAIASNIFVSGLLTITSNIPLSSPIGISGNVAVVANIPTTASGFNVLLENAIVVPSVGAANANVLQANGIIGSGSGFATLTTSVPKILYGPLSGQAYQSLATGNVVYNQQNGQSTTSFGVSQVSVSGGAAALSQYFTYSINEIAIPTNTNAQDQLTIGIYNSTGGPGASPFFNLNYSITGTHANVTYLSTNGVSLNAVQGFRTERGTKVATIGATSDTFNIAKSVDTLQIAVGTAASSTPALTRKLYGPYAVGATTNIANVSIGKVNGTITLSGSSGYVITGINNITGVPSVTQTITHVALKNLTTTPLVVLDSQANAGSNLILVGSGYVNTLSQQLQSAYNVSASPTMQVDQAYGTNRILVAGYTANQTTAAANAFIQQLYAATH